MSDGLEDVRQPSEEALERFGDEQGYSPYAHRAYLRWRQLAFYLWRFAREGHEEAATSTCSKFGHEARAAGRCERCGMPMR